MNGNEDSIIGTTGSRIFEGDEMKTIITVERFGASMSVVGVVLVFIAFGLSKRLRSVPNTFIVFASVANLGASIACLIGDSGMSTESSRLCQAQAFMFELFMQSDPWWSFAMAVNVYMVFFFSANPKRFLSYWWAYCIICYGVPLVPALWLLFLRGEDGERVYGDATIWCWIDGNWKRLRILTYYLPIWICIALSTCIYVAVGYYVFRQRNQLRKLSLSNPSRDNADGQCDSGEKNLFTNAAVMGSINTEVVQVTTTTHSTPVTTSGTSLASTRINWFEGPPEYPAQDNDYSSASHDTYHTVTRITADPAPKARRGWRLYGSPPLWSCLRRVTDRWRMRFSRMDPVKLAYLRTSFVFAVSVLVTWTPSSINRVHDVLHGDEQAGSSRHSTSYALNLASAVVLPLQGVWNAVIFFTTSCTAVREEIRARTDAFRGLPRGHLAASAARHDRDRERELSRGRTFGLELARRTNTNNRDSILDSSRSNSNNNIRNNYQTRGSVLGDSDGGGSSEDYGTRKAACEDELSELSSVIGASTLAHVSTTATTSSTMRVIKGGSLSSL